MKSEKIIREKLEEIKQEFNEEIDKSIPNSNAFKSTSLLSRLALLEWVLDE